MTECCILYDNVSLKILEFDYEGKQKKQFLHKKTAQLAHEDTEEEYCSRIQAKPPSRLPAAKSKVPEKGIKSTLGRLWHRFAQGPW
jgi:hypothetical protein